MTHYFAWDEISNEIQQENDQVDLRRRSDEIGMTFSHLLPNGVVVLKTDRHFGLECWANDANDAHTKFSAFDYYTKMKEY